MHTHTCVHTRARTHAHTQRERERERERANRKWQLIVVRYNNDIIYWQSYERDKRKQKCHSDLHQLQFVKMKHWFYTQKKNFTTKRGLQFCNKGTLLVSLKCIKSFHTVYIHKCNNSSVTDSHTHTGGEWGVKITCGRGGAHSTVPRKGVAWCISKSSASSGLTGQLVGNGSN